MPLNYLLSEYSKEKTFPFPDPERSPEEKNSYQYILDTIKAIYSAHARGRTAITHEEQNKFVENRLYGKGKQPSDYYKKILINKDDQNVSGIEGGKQLAEQRRKSWAQLDFENIVTYAPKVQDHFHGLFSEMEQDVIGVPIDQDSGMLMKSKKLRMLIELKFFEELKKLREKTGQKEPNWSFFPLNQAELDLYEASGGFKLNFAKAMEMLLKHTFKMSNWKDLKKHWINDAIHLGLIAGRVSENPDTGEVLTDYVNPENLIIQYSSYWDHRDSEFAGELQPWTINSLARYDVDSNELIRLAKRFAGYMGNPQLGDDVQIKDIGHFKIPVLEAYYIDYEDNYRKEYVNPFGKKRLIDVPYGKEPKNNNDKVRVVRDRYLYKGKWIVGSDVMFDWGKANDQLKENKEVRLPYKVYKLADKSITERLIPIYDQLEIGWLKFQNAQAMASSSGHAINMRLLSNITINEQQINPIEALKFMKETGDLIYSDIDMSTGTKYEGGAVQPVQPIEGGMRNELQEGIQKFEWAVRMIEHIAGLSPVSMGEQTNAQQSQVGTTQMALQGSQNIIQPVFNTIMDLKGGLARECMFTLQIKLRHNEDVREVYEQIVGKKDVQAIIQATKRGAKFGVHFEPRPTQKERNDLYELVKYSMTAGKNGQPLLEADEAWMIQQELLSGSNIKDIGLKLSYKIRKRKEELRKQQVEDAERQQRYAMQSSQQQHKQEMQKEQMQSQTKLKEEQMQQQGENYRKKLEINQSLKETALRYKRDAEDMSAKERMELAKLQRGQ